MFIIARAVAWGRRVALLTALGNSLGLVGLSVVIALGLGPLLQRSAALLDTVQVLGGGYLIYLGIDALRHRREHAQDMLVTETVRPKSRRIVSQGFTVGVLNPKALVFFSAVFPQFVDRQTGSVTVQLLLFGVIFAGVALLLDGTWAVVVGTGRNWFSDGTSRLVAMRTAGGVVMVALGVAVVSPLLWAHLH